MRLHRLWTAIALSLGAVLAIAPAAVKAQIPDRQLLSAFCDPANIRGSSCKKARGYPGGKACDIDLGKDRYSGKFLADRAILVIRYDSGCEPHATDSGGSVVFEQVGGAWKFKGFQPGYQANDCVIIARNDKQDRLICLTGHMGQGHLASGVAEMLFKQDFSKGIGMSLDFFVTADDSTGAYGSNIVTCKNLRVYFSLSKLGAGPRRDTVAVTSAYADRDTIRTVCKQGFPHPKEVFGELAPGDAYVPDGYEKNGRFVVDLVTRKVVPEAEFEKTAAPR